MKKKRQNLHTGPNDSLSSFGPWPLFTMWRGAMGALWVVVTSYRRLVARGGGDVAALRSSPIPVVPPSSVFRLSSFVVCRPHPRRSSSVPRRSSSFHPQSTPRAVAHEAGSGGGGDVVRSWDLSPVPLPPSSFVVPGACCSSAVDTYNPPYEQVLVGVEVCVVPPLSGLLVVPVPSLVFVRYLKRK
jgi:hypothetical protein